MNEQQELAPVSAKKAKAPSWTEDQILAALRDRYAPPAFAFFPHVRNQTGFSRRMVRTADAIAMSLYPSRGLHITGVEVKSSRGDWVRERDGGVPLVPLRTEVNTRKVRRKRDPERCFRRAGWRVVSPIEVPRATDRGLVVLEAPQS